MVSYSVGHELNEEGLSVFNDLLSGVFDSIDNSKDIIAVYSECGDIIAGSSSCNRVSGVLVLYGSADGVEVISAEEEGLAFECSSEVQGGMEITFRSRAISEVGDCNSIFLRESEPITSATGMGDLRSQRRRDGHDVQFGHAVVHWHLPPLDLIEFVPDALVHEILHLVPSPIDRSLLSVLREDQVLIL